MRSTRPGPKRTPGGVVTAALALLIAACASAPPALQPLPLPPQRLSAPAYSILPPDEPGWVKLPTAQDSIAAARYGAGVDETFAIDVRRVPLRPESRDNFASAARALNMGRLPPDRFRIARYDSAPHSVGRVACVRDHIVAEDTRPVRRSTGVTGPMEFELVVVTCPLPREPGAVVNASYSHRHQPASADPRFADNANRVLGTLALD